MGKGEIRLLEKEFLEGLGVLINCKSFTDSYGSREKDKLYIFPFYFSIIVYIQRIFKTKVNIQECREYF